MQCYIVALQTNYVRDESRDTPWVSGEIVGVELEVDGPTEADTWDVGPVEEHVCCDCEEEEDEACDGEENARDVCALGGFRGCDLEWDEDG